MGIVDGIMQDKGGCIPLRISGLIYWLPISATQSIGIILNNQTIIIVNRVIQSGCEKLRNALEEVVKPRIVQFLASRGLTLSDEKTHITHVTKGFDFLSAGMSENILVESF